MRESGPTAATRRIIRPPLNMKSPNFTWASTPTYYTATPDMTSSATSGRHLSKFGKNDRKCRLRRFRMNFSGTAFCLPHQLVGFLLLRCPLVNIWSRWNCCRRRIIINEILIAKQLQTLPEGILDSLHGSATSTNNTYITDEAESDAVTIAIPYRSQVCLCKRQ